MRCYKRLLFPVPGGSRWQHHCRRSDFDCLVSVCLVSFCLGNFIGSVISPNSWNFHVLDHP